MRGAVPPRILYAFVTCIGTTRLSNTEWHTHEILYKLFLYNFLLVHLTLYRVCRLMANCIIVYVVHQTEVMPQNKNRRISV
jgi:hypothetical protein